MVTIKKLWPEEVQEEIDAGKRVHGVLLSPYDALGRLREELKELEESITEYENHRIGGSTHKAMAWHDVCTEARQVAAVALRIVEELGP
jgi:hypothetical protein